ncbi:MAG TPA: chemotaxis protein CheB [Polyangia bacterium]|jgi:two-component system chemotaxis response regulator CheB
MSATTPPPAALLAELRAPGRIRLIAVGGSAGAIDALGVILGRLPAAFPLPLVVVVHLPRRRRSVLPEVLAARCRAPVREALDKQPLEAGGVYVGPPDYHTLLDEGPAVALSVDEPVNFSVPSIDVLFESAARVMGPALLGVLLSGANEDGAAGLAAIGAAGGLGVVQSPAEAAAPVMPAAGLARLPAAFVLDAQGIGQALAMLGAPED